MTPGTILFEKKTIERAQTVAHRFPEFDFYTD